MITFPITTPAENIEIQYRMFLVSLQQSARELLVVDWRVEEMRF